MSRGPGERAGLSAAGIAQAAVSLADAEGLNALTVRGLARRLDVEPMSLYHWFPRRSALLESVWDTIMAEAALPADHPSTSWQDFAEAAAHRYREVLLRHPALIPLMAERGARTARALDLVQGMIVGLRDRGLELHRAADLLDVISIFTIAHARTETRVAGEDGPPEVDPQRHAVLRELLQSGPADAGAADGARFQEALSALIRGLPESRDERR